MSSTRRTYHQSEVAQYLKCGLAWQFRYVEKLRVLSRPNLTVGTAVDRSVNANMVKKVHQEVATAAEVLAVASDQFDVDAQNTEWREDEKVGEHKDLTIQLANLHFTKVAPLITPKTVQEEFVIELEGGFDIGGAIDIVDSQGFVRDTKTSARQSSGNYIVERSFQPAMYTFAHEAIHGAPAAGFIFDILKKPTKTIGVEYEARQGVVTARDHEWLFSSIEAVHKGITAGVALPAPEGSWWCTEKWCPYWNVCKGKK